jgi:3-phenylpropionate/trans-cinnamate dioxygenase ferredoxin reductase subunit
VDERRFVAFYGRGGRLVGVLGMSQPAQVIKWRALIEAEMSFEGALATAAAQRSGVAE